MNAQNVGIETAASHVLATRRDIKGSHELSRHAPGGGRGFHPLTPPMSCRLVCDEQVPGPRLRLVSDPPLEAALSRIR
jgi:hypothetical protein